jgi:hypothetical protein
MRIRLVPVIVCVVAFIVLQLIGCLDVYLHVKAHRPPLSAESARQPRKASRFVVEEDVCVPVACLPGGAGRPTSGGAASAVVALITISRADR